jgi:hypothetical protein
VEFFNPCCFAKNVAKNIVSAFSLFFSGTLSDISFNFKLFMINSTEESLFLQISKKRRLELDYFDLSLVSKK